LARAAVCFGDNFHEWKLMSGDREQPVFQVSCGSMRLMRYRAVSTFKREKPALED